MSTVGERIREVREARGWTQEKLAGAAKISKSFLSEVENKGKNISLDLLLRVATALDASVEYLATGGGDEAKSRGESRVRTQRRHSPSRAIFRARHLTRFRSMKSRRG